MKRRPPRSTRTATLVPSTTLFRSLKERAGSIVDADVQRYRRFTGPALAAAGLEPLPDFSSEEIASNARRWRILQQRGKRLTVLRLAKASFTFAGGIDYLAWKDRKSTRLNSSH